MLLNEFMLKNKFDKIFEDENRNSVILIEDGYLIYLRLIKRILPPGQIIDFTGRANLLASASILRNLLENHQQKKYVLLKMDRTAYAAIVAQSDIALNNHVESFYLSDVTEETFTLTYLTAFQVNPEYFIKWCVQLDSSTRYEIYEKLEKEDLLKYLQLTKTKKMIHWYRSIS